MIARFIAASLLAAGQALMAQTVAGRWDATVDVRGLEIPFRLDLSGAGSNIQGFFFNGDQRDPSTSGRFENGELLLRWDDYGARIQASFHDDMLEGKYERARSSGVTVFPFRAKRFTPPASTDAKIPSIGGLWLIPTNSQKGEGAWRFIVRQSGAEVSAAILRVDGDTGALTGRYRDGKFVLSHFSGARPSLMEVSLGADGTLDILQNGKNKLMAVRAEEARAKGMPQPDDPAKHTTVRDPAAVFQFSYPDLNGKTVSNTDARFKGKVVLVDISGSWCPNCHDETPFLVDLYRKYRGRGLEVVALSFEEGDQLKDPANLRAFIKKYGVEYPVLLAGEPGEAKDKLPLAVNFDAFPTTFSSGATAGYEACIPDFRAQLAATCFVRRKKNSRLKWNVCCTRTLDQRGRPNLVGGRHAGAIVHQRTQNAEHLIKHHQHRRADVGESSAASAGEESRD